MASTHAGDAEMADVTTGTDSMDISADGANQRLYVADLFHTF